MWKEYLDGYSTENREKCYINLSAVAGISADGPDVTRVMMTNGMITLISCPYEQVKRDIDTCFRK